MLIDEYFQQIGHDIAQSAVITDSDLRKDKRSLYIGFLEGTLTFLDGSTLRFIEFVNVKVKIDRYKYSYHYQDAGNTLIFRYDMAPHHQNIRTFLHHKHTANQQVIEAEAPTLQDVLEEIEKLVM